MSADEFTPLDQRCASLLAACHDALLAGETASKLTGPEIPPELQGRLERDLACVQLLDQAWAQPVSGPGKGPGKGDATQKAEDSVPFSRSCELPTAIGRFQIRRELGRGGYGIVFLAYDPQLGREVALKVPRPEAVLTPALRERFLREARAAAVLDHPNLVPVYDAGELGPVCYIASAYCPGTTLDAWLKARVEPVPWQEAAALVATLAEAVHHAHVQRVVHRDLKPANVLLQIADCRLQIADCKSSILNLESAIPKITDFGLAKFHSLDSGAAAPEYPTQSGAIVGTPRYMAPEQAVGSSQAVGPAVDIHALGTILYEVLTGRPPFVAESVLDLLEQVRSQEPLPPSRLRLRLPRDLETICLRCLQKEPGQRYASAAELAEDLRRFRAGEPIRARPVRAWERIVKWARRRPTAAALVAMLILAPLVVVAGLVVALVVIADKQLETEKALGREKQAREDIEQTSYLNGITSAEHEISLRDWGRAEELLKGCPEKLRGWEWHYLKRLRRVPRISPLAIGEPITMSGGGFDLAFNPGGRLLAIPSGDHRIRIWDASNGREVLTLSGHTGRVLSLAYSPDGRHLASTSEDSTLRVWDVSGGLGKGDVREPVFTCHHKEHVIGVTFSPDGRRLASVSGKTDQPGEVKVWDAASGEELVSFPGPQVPNPVVHLAFSFDGRLLASGSGENKVKVWDVTARRERYTLSGHSQPILNVTFTPDGRRLIGAGRDRMVNVWELPPGEPERLPAEGRVLAPQRTLPDILSTSPWCLALSPDGSRLAIGGPKSDGNVRVYDMTTGALLHILRGDDRVICVAFSPDGRRLAAAGHHPIVRLWDTNTGDEVLSLRGHGDEVGRVLFSADGQYLASASADGTVRVWDASPFDESADHRIRTLGGKDDGEFNGVAFGPDGRLLASASADGSIKLWDARTGEEVRAFHGHKKPALCVAFSSPDGRHLLSGSMDRSVKLWDIQTGQERPLPGCDRFELLVYSVAFSPDGHAFATGAHQQAQIWDLRGRSLLRRPLQADPEFVSCVRFSPDGRQLVTVGHTGIAKVWDVTNGQEVCRFPGHHANIVSVAFHPRGKYVASGGNDKKVRLWDPATGHENLALSDHTDYVSALTFSPDGKYLASASSREVIVWDASSFQKLHTFDRIAGKIFSVAFSPDGKHLAAGIGYKGKGEIKIWDWDPTLWDSGYTSPKR